MEKAKRSKIGKNNRAKGHNFERKTMHLYRDVGYKDTVTSRNDSRLLDACKIDLSRLPLFPQCKMGYPSMSVNGYIKLFEEMESALKESKIDFDYPKVIHHRKGRKKYEDLVIMPSQDYFKLLKQIKDEN